MADDRAQFKRAQKCWESLHRAGDFSVPKDIGKVAIFCSYAEGAEGNTKGRHKEIKVFRKEAFAIADVLMAQDRNCEVILNCQYSDFEAVLSDPEFSDIITIGHGDFSSFSLRDENEDEIDWQQIMYESDHLKTGFFIQRQCGLYNYTLPVPLGLFCMSDARNIYAPANEYFSPRGLQHQQNALLQPVTDQSTLSYADIRALPAQFLERQLAAQA